MRGAILREHSVRLGASGIRRGMFRLRSDSWGGEGGRGPRIPARQFKASESTVGLGLRLRWTPVPHLWGPDRQLRARFKWRRIGPARAWAIFRSSATGWIPDKTAKSDYHASRPFLCKNWSNPVASTGFTRSVTFQVTVTSRFNAGLALFPGMVSDKVCLNCTGRNRHKLPIS
jgi:hypothetical protein